MDEIISDVFLRYWRYSDRYDSERGSLKNYLVLLTKSMSINQLKKNRRVFLPLVEFPLEDLQEEAERQTDIWNLFFEALLLLDEPTREICLERYFYELKPKVIANNLGLSVVEVKNRLYRGKKKIRKEMEYLMLEQGGTQT
ncbi:RNA polymerase sigma factor [Enterococcus rivorum]|uniref:RNA polymerase sigma factor n=1 Tax=Enterococcus rivorum TaxID=762845 RepID=UPI003640BD9D